MSQPHAHIPFLYLQNKKAATSQQPVRASQQMKKRHFNMKVYHALGSQSKLSKTISCPEKWIGDSLMGESKFKLDSKFKQDITSLSPGWWQSKNLGFRGSHFLPCKPSNRENSSAGRKLSSNERENIDENQGVFILHSTWFFHSCSQFHFLSVMPMSVLEFHVRTSQKLNILKADFFVGLLKLA